RRRRGCPACSRQVDLDHAVGDPHRVHGHREIGIHAAETGGELEIEAVPRAHRRVGLQPAFGQGPVLVRTGGPEGMEATAARVEHGHRDAVMLGIGTVAYRDVVDARYWHEG